MRQRRHAEQDFCNSFHPLYQQKNISVFSSVKWCLLFCLHAYVFISETNQVIYIHVVFCIYVHMHMDLICIASLYAFLLCPRIVLVCMCARSWSYDWKRGRFKNGAKSQLPKCLFEREILFFFSWLQPAHFLSLSLFPSFCQHITFWSISFCFQRITQLTDGQTKY